MMLMRAMALAVVLSIVGASTAAAIEISESTYGAVRTSHKKSQG